ncbi:MAG: alpha-amylase [Flexilinea sp.]|nr:alpha-amylase [Flexilinea sp.]
MEFHISGNARKHYDFSEKLFSYNGNVIFADFRAVREFTAKINAVRAKEGRTQTYAGEINALGLLDEIMHALLDQYRKRFVPRMKIEAYDRLEETLGEENLEATLKAFCEEFPPLSVVKNEQTVAEYLDPKVPQGLKNRYDTVEEILVLWITNRNPAAMKAAGELFDESHLAETSDYNKLILNLDNYVRELPAIEGMNIIEYLRQPALKYPDSLFDQLNYVQHNWSVVLGEYLRRLLISMDLMKEEYKEHGFGGPGTAEVPSYDDMSGAGYAEYEAFSMDSDWMPRLVLMAKNAYVWLDQLSKKYGWEIRYLHEIPDEELKALADEGFTGLWLIGLWERSKASQTIKQWCGNPEALASAYSLADYRIADDLGGEDSFNDLKARAWRYGIRLASDMVPNHMGIDSDWVLYHPDRFLSLPESPYPNYSFNCGNLSPDPNIGIRIEDHYFSRSDAAVVFQRIDYRTGDCRYIYHGNDGTTMPWNDTAQLNYLNPEVRETVIQTILSVAKHTPIIRFDAAMTLAKKHYQRLWFPEPGSGGDIATRAEHGLTKAEFDQAFPQEFWREVVDRVAVEAPDTLLLAEAFWLMESYFVRTLGMHRVYNSAFMNLLRDENNQRYRMLLKNTLEFDPEILKRYVNFLNNPDEKTAVEQFGTGDKYFGICLLMATMPGLPMFGHGQLEGFSEKYGMEYKKAYKNEQVNTGLMQRHQREVFPLLHMRKRFAEVQHFVLYNFANSYGNVDENVYAYSNYGENCHSLVVYNNRYGETEGYVRQSVTMARKENDEKVMFTTTLSESLGLHNDSEYFVVLHDHIRGLDFIRSSEQLCREGFYLRLHGYQYYVFSEVYEVRDDDQHTWRQLCDWLNGEGTADIREAIEEVRYGQVLRPYRGCFDGKKLRWLHHGIGTRIRPETWDELRNGTWNDFQMLSDAFRAEYGYPYLYGKALYNLYVGGMVGMLKDPVGSGAPDMKQYAEAARRVSELVHTKPLLWVMTLIAQQERLLTDDLGEDRPDIHEKCHLVKPLLRCLRDAELFELTPNEQVEIIRWLYFNIGQMKKWTAETLETDLNDLLDQDDTHRLLKANYFEKICWFNKEAADLLVDLIHISGYYLKAFDPAGNPAEQIEDTLLFEKAAAILADRIEAAEYQYDRLFWEEEDEKAEAEEEASPSDEDL